MNNKHIRIYLPLTVFIMVALSVGAVKELTHVHQFRTLVSAVSDGVARTVPGYVQGTRRERRSRKGGYRNTVFVDYATPDARLTLKTTVDDEMHTRLYPGKRVVVTYHPDNPRIAVMEGAHDMLGWGRRLAILFMAAGLVICAQLIIYWVFSPVRRLSRDMSQRLG